MPDDKKRKSKKADGVPDKLGKATYLEQLAGHEIALNNMARWLQATGKRLVVVVEGRDTAGKGGVISAITGTLSPRQVKAVALPKPTDREKAQWYSSATCRTCPRQARWCCSTAAGTTGPVSSG